MNTTSNDEAYHLLRDYAKNDIVGTGTSTDDTEEFKQLMLVNGFRAFLNEFLEKYYKFIPCDIKDAEGNNPFIKANSCSVTFTQPDDDGDFTCSVHVYNGTNYSHTLTIKKRTETYLIGFVDKDIMFVDFEKKLIAYLDERSLSREEYQFWKAFEKELKQDEYQSPEEKEYSGILPETIYTFDTAHFQVGSLIKMHILKSCSEFDRLGWRPGYYYNGMVVGFSQDKTSMYVHIKATDDAFKDITLFAKGIKDNMKIIKVG